jgi:hypothetical protein
MCDIYIDMVPFRGGITGLADSIPVISDNLFIGEAYSFEYH